MSDNFRVVECLYAPSEVFCIYDNTKIAYLAGNYICVREVVSPDVAPTFIKLSSPHCEPKPASRFIGLVSYPNLLVLGEKAPSKDVLLHFYSGNEEQQIKVQSELARKTDSEQELRYEIHQSSDLVYLIVHREGDSEIIAVNAARRQVVARGFASGEIADFRVKAVEDADYFSFRVPESREIVEYQILSGKNQDPGLRMVEKGRVLLPAKAVLYCWCKEELLLLSGSTVRVFLEGKEMQTI